MVPEVPSLVSPEVSPVVPPVVSVVHSETLERYALAGQDGEKVLVRATGERADDLARR